MSELDDFYKTNYDFRGEEDEKVEALPELKMREDLLMISMNELFEKWQESYPNKTQYQIYRDLDEVLLIVAEEQGAFHERYDDEHKNEYI